MKTLSLIAIVIAAFFIIAGFVSKTTAGVLSYAVMFIGAVIAIFVVLIWILKFFKEKKERENAFDISDS